MWYSEPHGMGHNTHWKATLQEEKRPGVPSAICNNIYPLTPGKCLTPTFYSSQFFFCRINSGFLPIGEEIDILKCPLLGLGIVMDA